MAGSSRTPGICDQCGFQYKLQQLRTTSYNTRVCPECWDGIWNIQTNPLNYAPIIDADLPLQNPRPPSNDDRNITWENATMFWEDQTNDWNLV
mgnify:CR=1 FL=1